MPVPTPDRPAAPTDSLPGLSACSSQSQLCEAVSGFLLSGGWRLTSLLTAVIRRPRSGEA
ncbi:hypothetical protein ACNKHP_24945 [Shigella boydii]